jgi:putative redox protein
MPEDKSSNPMDLIMNVLYEDGTHFLAENGAGSRIAMGGDYPHPIEYLIASLGGCTGTMVVKGLSEKGVKPESFVVKVEGSRRKTPPTVFEKIHVTFTLSGDLEDRMVAEVIQETMTLKCPIAVTLGRVGDMTWEHRVIQMPR